MCACEPGFRCSRCRRDDDRDVVILMEWSPQEVDADRVYRHRYEDVSEPRSERDA